MILGKFFEAFRTPPPTHILSPLAPPSLRVLTLTEYDATFGLPVAFEPQTFCGSLADVLTTHNRTNLRLAETEKYAHVTYFFNCGEERPAPGEDRILVPSPTVPTYDLQPEMSAAGITDHLVADLDAGRHDVVICNFANADMVGHTGHLDAAVAAVETLDRCLARIVAAVQATGGTLIITADHGNAEQMWDDQRDGPHTAHTTNPITRTVLVVAAWYVFPARRFVVIPAVIVIIYLISIYVLARRPLPSQADGT